MLRNWTTGQSLEEFCGPLPPEASDTPRNFEPSRKRLPPLLTDWLMKVICGRHEFIKPKPTSYNSEVAVTAKFVSSPPATNTLPFGSNSAMNEVRAVASGAVRVHFPVAGSKISALERTT